MEEPRKKDNFKSSHTSFMEKNNFKKLLQGLYDKGVFDNFCNNDQNFELFLIFRGNRRFRRKWERNSNRLQV